MSGDEVDTHLDSTQAPPLSPSNEGSIIDDDFGDFEDPQPQSQTPGLAHTQVSPQLSTCKASQIASLTDEELRSMLPHVGIKEADDHDSLRAASEAFTPTSAQLWQKLTEVNTQPLGSWNSTRAHKNLAVLLGLPLNLDTSLPKVVSQALDLPVKSSDQEAEGLQNVPEWALLSATSAETLARMTAADLDSHIAKLEVALIDVRNLKDNLENREMDLRGEKNILEGMVESLLVFTQRNQRERIKVKIAKNLRR